jgi:RNA polymerase sigma-70 factor, ECF subfamily
MTSIARFPLDALSPSVQRPDAAGEASRRARVPGTAQAFDREFRARFDELFGVLFRLLDRLSGDAALASDIAQETLIRLYRRAAMPDDLRAWIVTVALNELRRTERRASRRRLLLALHRVVVPQPREQTRADDALVHDERRTLVRAALDALPPRDRAMLLLRAEGYSYREIAIALGMKEASVGTLLSRAKDAFARAIGGDARVTD